MYAELTHNEKTVTHTQKKGIFRKKITVEETVNTTEVTFTVDGQKSEAFEYDVDGAIFPYLWLYGVSEVELLELTKAELNKIR